MWLVGGCEDRCVSVATQMEECCLTASEICVTSKEWSHCFEKIWQQLKDVGEATVCTQACARRYLKLDLFILPTVQEPESVTSANLATYLEE